MPADRRRRTPNVVLSMSTFEGHLPVRECFCRGGGAEGTSELGVGRSTFDIRRVFGAVLGGHTG
jgi:hypothetical protein